MTLDSVELLDGVQSFFYFSTCEISHSKREIGAAAVKRYGMVIRLKPEHEDAYRAAHAAVPPDVLRTIHACNIRNYSIFLRSSVLFGYFEYVGSNFEADMAKMAADPATQRWWAIMKPMQDPYPDRAPEDWWTTMDEIFHVD